MPLYRWRSETLKNYARGDILAIGRDIEEARANARSAWPAFALERWEWLFDQRGVLDADDLAERDAKTAAFEKDIAGSPEAAEAFLISGSE